MVSLSKIQAIENNEIQREYDERTMMDCKKQSAYCFASIALFIVAGLVGTPGIAEMIPGGVLTLGFVSLGVVILVILLCKLQMS